jgi:hypothetical protein
MAWRPSAPLQVRVASSTWESTDWGLITCMRLRNRLHDRRSWQRRQEGVSDTRYKVARVASGIQDDVGAFTLHKRGGGAVIILYRQVERGLGVCPRVAAVIGVRMCPDLCVIELRPMPAADHRVEHRVEHRLPRLGPLRVSPDVGVLVAIGAELREQLRATRVPR